MCEKDNVRSLNVTSTLVSYGSLVPSLGTRLILWYMLHLDLFPGLPQLQFPVANMERKGLGHFIMCNDIRRYIDTREWCLIVRIHKLPSSLLNNEMC